MYCLCFLNLQGYIQILYFLLNSNFHLSVQNYYIFSYRFSFVLCSLLCPLSSSRMLEIGRSYRQNWWVYRSCWNVSRLKWKVCLLPQMKLCFLLKCHVFLFGPDHFRRSYWISKDRNQHNSINLNLCQNCRKSLALLFLKINSSYLSSHIHNSDCLFSTNFHMISTRFFQYYFSQEESKIQVHIYLWLKNCLSFR